MLLLDVDVSNLSEFALFGGETFSLSVFERNVLELDLR